MNLTQKLKILKNIQPQKKWLKQTREIFLIQVKKDFVFKKQEENNFQFAFPKLFLKPIGILTMIAILFFGTSTFAIKAAKNTVPGDPLYIIKINLEKTQKILTNNKEKKVGLAMESTKERLKELKQLSHSDSSVKNEKNIKTATQNLNEGIQEIKVSLNNLKEESNSKTTVETAKTVDAQTTEYEKELIQTKEQASPAIKEEIEKVLNSIEETNLRAIQTIINEQPITKEDSVSKDETTNIIENKIKQTEEKIAEVKTKATDLVEVSNLEVLTQEEQGGGEIDQNDSQKIEENTEAQENNETIKQENTEAQENNETIKQENTVKQENNETIKQENTEAQENNETIKQENTVKQENNETIKQENTKTINQQKIQENQEKSKEIMQEANKAEEILKEVKESLQQKDLNKNDLNIIAEKVAVSKKLTNIANKVADKAIGQ